MGTYSEECWVLLRNPLCCIRRKFVLYHSLISNFLQKNWNETLKWFSTKLDKMWYIRSLYSREDTERIMNHWKLEQNVSLCFLPQFQFQVISFCGVPKCHLPHINSLCIGHWGKRRVDGGGLRKSSRIKTRIDPDLSRHREKGGHPESHPGRHRLRVEPEVHLQVGDHQE